jgi:hypothetical protein
MARPRSTLTAQQQPDFQDQNHGSIFLLGPITDAAVAWIG